jgi:hypothetical protein
MINTWWALNGMLSSFAFWRRMFLVYGSTEASPVLAAAPCAAKSHSLLLFHMRRQFFAFLCPRPRFFDRA